MSMQNLQQNISEEREIIREIMMFVRQYSYSDGKEKAMITQTIGALFEMLKIINNSIPSLLDGISVVKSLKGNEKEIKGMVKLTYEKKGVEKSITIKEADRKKFIEDLRMLDFSMKKIRKEGRNNEISFKEFKKPSKYARISNKFFAKISNRLVDKGYFSKLGSDLRQANLPFIINTYVSIIFFTSLIVLGISILLFLMLIFFDLSINFPFIIRADITIRRLARNFLICLALPVLAFISVYLFPYAEKQSIGKKIEHELPFVVIHMSAIAGSGIEPTQIFKIIALGHEYPYMRQEIRKIMNQVNFFGFDLVSSLKSSAKSAPSKKLAELLNGLATTISSGGSLPEFLDKRAETLLFDYKLEREKSTKMAESFMDIYISVVIAAPMIMMLLMILMSTGIVSIGLSINAITIIIVSIVALINLVFLVFLHLKQPNY